MSSTRGSRPGAVVLGLVGLALIALLVSGAAVVRSRNVAPPAGLLGVVDKQATPVATDVVPVSVAELDDAPVVPQPRPTPTPQETGRAFPPVAQTTRAAVIVEGMGDDADAITVALAEVEGIIATSRVHVAEVTLGGVTAEVAAVDLDTFRPFTPKETADSQPLWQRLDAGDVAVTYEFGERHTVDLGMMLGLGPDQSPTRVGAYATNGTPPLADAIISTDNLSLLGGGAREIMLVGLEPEASPTATVEVLAEFGLAAEEIPDPRAPSTQTVIPTGGITPENVWDHLAICESSGDWQINTGNGYYGGLQFLPESWAYVGGTGLPHEHSREEQIYRASLLWQVQGWEAWPQCARKLGLIVDPPPQATSGPTEQGTPGPDSPSMS